MKKIKELSTMVAVIALVVCMCGVIFGYDKERFFMGGVTVTSSQVHLANDTFDATKSKYCTLNPYYTSISADGSYAVYLYKRPSDGSRIFYDDANRSIKATTTPGFYTSRIYVDSNNRYEPAMRCSGTTMKLNYLRVFYD